MKKTQFTKKSIPVIIITVLFALSLIPAVYVGMFDYATGDDLLYGSVIKNVIRNGGSWMDCIHVAWENTISEYYSFQGTLVSGLLHRFMPAISGEKLYVITPLLALGVLILGNFLLCHEVLVNKLHFSKYFSLIINSFLCFVTIQFMPYPRGGIYWFTGMLAYTFPYGILLLTLAGSVHFLQKQSTWLLLLLIVGSLVACGSGFPVGVLFVFVILVVLCSEFIFRKRNRISVKPVFLLIIPYLIGLSLFTLDVMAPGNRTRAVGGDTTFSVSRIFRTLIGCAKETVVDGFNYFISVRPLIVFVILVIACSWHEIGGGAYRKQNVY